MTLQQVFNKVAKHLLKQNRRAMDGGACLYRDGHGRSCAVGCLIPDGQYRPGLEPWSPGRLVRAGKLPGVGEEAVKLLNELQGTHDSNTPSLWPDTLREVAKEHELNARTVTIHEKAKATAK